MSSPGWVMHLDRPLINPLELMFCAHVRPHELTKRFDAKDTQIAAWTDLASPLARFLELATVADPLMVAPTLPITPMNPVTPNHYGMFELECLLFLQGHCDRRRWPSSRSVHFDRRFDSRRLRGI